MHIYFVGRGHTCISIAYQQLLTLGYIPSTPLNIYIFLNKRILTWTLLTNNRMHKHISRTFNACLVYYVNDCMVVCCRYHNPFKNRLHWLSGPLPVILVIINIAISFFTLWREGLRPDISTCLRLDSCSQAATQRGWITQCHCCPSPSSSLRDVRFSSLHLAF